MIRINLLPPGRRAQSSTLALLATLPWRPIGISFLGILFLYSFLLAGLNLSRGVRLNRLNAEWQGTEPDRLHLAEVRTSVDQLHVREQAVLTMKAPERRWTPRLSLLMDGLVSNLWFRAFLFRMMKKSEMQELLAAELQNLGIPDLEQVIPQISVEGEEDSGQGGMEGAPPPAEPGMEGAPLPLSFRPVLLIGGSALVTSQGSGAPVRRFIQKLKEHPEFSQWFDSVELKDVSHREVKGEEVSDYLIVLYPKGL